MFFSCQSYPPKNTQKLYTWAPHGSAFRRSKSASLKALEVKQGEEAAQDRGPCRGWWDVGDAGGGCKDELGKSFFFPGKMILIEGK